MVACIVAADAVPHSVRNEKEDDRPPTENRPIERAARSGSDVSTPRHPIKTIKTGLLYNTPDIAMGSSSPVRIVDLPETASY